VFSEHNLATDGSFNEFQVIICRGILWNFNHRLRERVDKLIYDSPQPVWVLALARRNHWRPCPMKIIMRSWTRKPPLPKTRYECESPVCRYGG